MVITVQVWLARQLTWNRCYQTQGCRRPSSWQLAPLVQPVCESYTYRALSGPGPRGLVWSQVPRRWR